MADVAGTPYISRTPFEGAGMETPMPYEAAFEVDRDREVKRRKINLSSGLDVSLVIHSEMIVLSTPIQNFQASYTSEDNSSFMDILQEENRVKREKHAWAYAAEEKAKQSRLRLEQSRRQLLIQAGGYVPDDGLLPVKQAIEPPTHRLALTLPKEGENREGAEEKGKSKAIEAGPSMKPTDGPQTEPSTALVIGKSEGSSAKDKALVRRAPELNAPDISEMQLAIPNALPSGVRESTNKEDDNGTVEIVLDPSSHLARALAEVGLPETAIVTRQGDLVPSREIASGGGDGVGRRGEVDRLAREAKENEVMGELKDNREIIVPTWGYKVRTAVSIARGMADVLSRPS